MPRIIAIGFLSLAVAMNSNADDNDRLDLLEKEIRDLKIRISKLEAPSSKSGSQPEPLPSGEDWRFIPNWRKLTTSLGPSDVRKLLGEPDRIKGGVVAYWYYHNDGEVTFLNDRVTSWNEPEQ
jgi:hypothetical protein